MNEDSYKMFFRALSNGTRFGIIRLLKRKGPRSVTMICRELGFEQSRVSHNLRSLVACGFVHSEWKGKNKVYSLDEKHIVPMLENIDRHIARYGKRLEECNVLRGRGACQFEKEA